MTRNDEFDDDYVAKLLTEEAKKSSANYAARGLSGLLPKSSKTNVPKPNTRFLSQIVREADNHNAALKKKEELEARIRLREMQSGVRGKKRERDSHEDRHDRKKRSKSEHEGRTSQHTREMNRRSYTRDDDHYRSRFKRKRPRQVDHEKQREEREYSRSENPITERHGKREFSESDSDPLADIVGPMPDKTKHAPVQVRGRGAHKSNSNIDDHFADGYDPNEDVQNNSELSDDGEDWDQALEALRDRKMWKQKQSQRLREAGWDDKQIQKWEEGSLNNNPENEDLSSVRWAKRGEKREWDKGKEENSPNPISGGQHETSKMTGKKADLESAWSRKNNGFLKSFRKAIG